MLPDRRPDGALCQSNPCLVRLRVFSWPTASPRALTQILDRATPGSESPASAQPHVRPTSYRARSTLPPLTLEKLRARFWWLGSGRKSSHIFALEGDTATIKVIQRTWNCHTQKYEAAVARDFAGLGLKIVWQRCWCRAFREMIDTARTQAAKAGQPFDEAAFIEHQRAEETARQVRDDARD